MLLHHERVKQLSMPWPLLGIRESFHIRRHIQAPGWLLLSQEVGVPVRLFMKEMDYGKPVRLSFNPADLCPKAWL
jgi:hypothetical protein